MKLRNKRILETGGSNLDYKSSKIERPDIPRLDFLATAKSNNFANLIKTKLAKTAPQPLKDQEQFYQQNSIQIKQKPQLTRERFAQLEEKELLKRVFTGDSYTIYDNDDNKQIIQKRITQQKQKQKEIKEDLIFQKHEENATAIAETQLVGFENKKTLEGLVDLDKIKELRRAIRRRYANRKNFQKIFNQWDTKSNGVISSQNVYDMVNKMGININFNEARVLVASSDVDKSGDLNLNEFMDLIFNTNDALNVNLKSLPAIPEQNQQTYENAQNAIGTISENTLQNRNKRHINQLSLILKNKLSTIKTFTFQADNLKQGFISQEKLVEIINKLGIPENIMSSQDIKYFFNNHKINDHLFDYRNFIDYLRKFQFNPEDIYNENEVDNMKEKTDKQKFLQLYNCEEDKKLVIQDPSNSDSWTLEKIRQKSRRVFRILNRYYNNKDDFENYLMQQLKINSKEEFATKQILKSDLTKTIENLFLSLGEKDVNKTEIESFLSLFSYNNYNFTNAAQVSEIIYTQNENDWFNNVQWRQRKPVPNNLQKNPQIDEFPEIEYENNQNLQNEKSLKNKALSRVSSAPYYQKSINDILNKFENRIFCGSQKSYKIFKKFDVDQDGYVSRQDLITKIQEMNILNNNEIKPFIEYLDPQNQGYVNFTQFSQKIRNGMLTTDPKCRQLVIPFIAPCKEQLEDMKSIIPQLNPKLKEIKKDFQAQEGSVNNFTRFNATPQFYNTFTNFRGSYKDDSNKYANDNNHRIQYQKEEQQKKKQYYENRINKITEHQKHIEENKQNQQKLLDMRSQNKMKAIGLAQWTYEHRAHIQNNWM